jgi:hypothetical protein
LPPNGLRAATNHLAEWQDAEEELEREWLWLVEALNTVARARAEHGDAAAFRLMQHQAVRVGQRRVELRMQMAQLDSSESARGVSQG